MNERDVAERLEEWPGNASDTADECEALASEILAWCHGEPCLPEDRPNMTDADIVRRAAALLRDYEAKTTIDVLRSEGREPDPRKPVADALAAFADELRPDWRSDDSAWGYYAHLVEFLSPPGTPSGPGPDALAREIIQVVVDNAVPREDGGISVKPQAAARVADLLRGRCEAVDHHGRRCARQSGHKGHHNAAALLRSEGGPDAEIAEGVAAGPEWP